LRSCLATLTCLMACVCCSAQDWERTIAQFQHTAWGAKEGAPDQIFALAQTEDGYLWIGTGDGLYRFDGATFERYEPRSGGRLPNGLTFRLWSNDRGELWIGARSIVRTLKDGNLRTYTTEDGVPEGMVFGFAEDPRGTMWVASLGGLARLEGNRWKKVGDDWNFPGHTAQTIFLDREGTLWVATENTLVFLPSGAKAFQPTGSHIGQVYQIGQAPNGKLWMAETTRSVRPIPVGSRLLPPDETEIRVGSAGILLDRAGALWMTTIGDGLRRAPHPERLRGKPTRFSKVVESFTAKDGLTDDYAISILQDREGNIWVGTHNGLDRFRKSDFVPVALPVPLRQSQMVAGEGGDLWLQGMNLDARVHGGHAITQLWDRVRRSGPITKGHEIIGPPEQPHASYHDSSGRIWWISDRNLQCFENDRFRKFPLPEALSSHSGQEDIQFTEDGSGVLWVAASNAGLFSMKNGVWTHFEAPGAVPPTPQAAYTDGLGRAWFGYHGGEIVLIDNGTMHLISPKGALENVAAINGRGQHIWVGGDFGLAFFDGSGFRQVTTVDASTLGGVREVEEARDGGLWLGHPRGVIYIAESEIQHFLSDPDYRVHYELFDATDGLPGTFHSETHEAQGTDGRLWFAASEGLAWLDPAHLSRNTLPPPVVIRSLTADGKPYPYWTHAELPPLTRSLQIQFTALSLSIPERVRFRYKLEGQDKDWQDGGSRREVSYGNLDPRKYRFHVIACNNDGVWNETGATLNFSVLPAWHQTILFRSGCVVIFLTLLWALYQLRLRQLEGQFHQRLEARVEERTRIARELHDTLLQSFHGVLFRLQAVSDQISGGPIKQQLDSTIDQAAAAITEGRDAVQDLRSSTVVTNSLAVDISALGQELAASQTNQVRADFHIEVQGAPRDLHPILRDEVYRITGEALRNAFQHAQARQIEVEIQYEEQQLRLLVRDDGKGIDSKILEGEAPAGHFGLRGLRERAAIAGGRLEVWGKLGAGTEVDLSIPASVAYATPAARGSWFSRKAAIK
jgi:signal transduction histidine kinase/ligand-binding sensor domain-containing protein